jgi:hypothetical protein
MKRNDILKCTKCHETKCYGGGASRQSYEGGTTEIAASGAEGATYVACVAKD